MCRAWAAALQVSFQGHMYSVGIAISTRGVVLHDGVGTCLVMVLELNTLTFVPHMFPWITWVLAGFRAWWPVLRIVVAGFENH
jgi:hypothetical protein